MRKKTSDVPQNRNSAREALVELLVSGDGKASPEDRLRAFNNTDLPEPLGRLLTEVATGTGQVTDSDITQAKEAGFSEDQIFELVICAAVGAASRQYQSGLTALARVQSRWRGE